MQFKHTCPIGDARMSTPTPGIYSTSPTLDCTGELDLKTMVLNLLQTYSPFNNPTKLDAMGVKWYIL